MRFQIIPQADFLKQQEKQKEKEILAKIKRPFDHKPNRVFHFVSIEHEGIFYLVNGLNKIVGSFLREGDLVKEVRKIRLEALESFLSAKNDNGGFKFN